MRTLGNILWHIPFLGFLSAFWIFLLGTLLVLSVVGAPVGLGLIQWSKFLLSPFSSAMVDKRDLNAEQNKLWQTFGLIVRIVYLPFGLLFAVVLVLQIILLFFSIVGIPVAVVVAKSLSTCINPVNKVSVPKAVADELEQRKAKEQVARHLG